MGCTTTWQEQRGKTSRSNTENNPSCCTNTSSNEFGQIGFATTSTTVQQESRSMGVENTIHYSMIESILISIYSGQSPVNIDLLFLSVICQLFIDQSDSFLMTPVSLWSRHRWKVLQMFAMSPELLVYEI
jgi:hypothetical protein